MILETKYCAQIMLEKIKTALSIYKNRKSDILGCQDIRSIRYFISRHLEIFYKLKV